MSHPKVLDSSKAALLVVDVQEAFRNVISDFEGLASKCAVVVRGFKALDRPVFITEQYPKGLGRTATEIRGVMPTDFEYIEKTTFSSCGAGRLEDEFRTAGAEQIVVCGLETHVCVNQTVHDLLDRGFIVHLLTDCIASRSEHDKKTGLTKMLSSGAVPSSVEMSLFELMRDARHEKFKEIQALIKGTSVGVST
ncbi:MAG TPA: hydrolase [Pyrinomonadaceae bacterium]